MTVGHDLHYTAGSIDACGYYSQPRSDMIRGGVLLVHEAPGLGAHLRRRADALAALGYAALAVDLHGGGRLAANPSEARQWVDALKADPDELIARLSGGLDALMQQSGAADNLAAAGYCFGGWCALELARAGATLRSTSVFHGALASTRGASGIAGSVLVCTGDADPFVPAEQVAAFTAEMAAAKIDWQLCLYGGVGHGYTDRDVPDMPGFGYDVRADRRAWQSFVAQLAEHSADPERAA